jgi:hypothetical protein
MNLLGQALAMEDAATASAPKELIMEQRATETKKRVGHRD